MKFKLRFSCRLWNIVS